MSGSPPTAVLTSANPDYTFNAQPGARYFPASSGVVGGSPATVKLQHKARPEDDWVDNPNVTFEEGEHLSGILDIVMVYNRVVVADPDGTTDLALML